MDNRARLPINNDPREAELVEAMILDGMEYIHGKGSQEIVKALETSTDTSATMAAIVYKVVKGVADRNAKTSQVEMDMDMMLGVTTEIIDMTVEVAEAAQQIMPGSNVDQLKEDTLLRVTALHGEQLEGEDGFTPEQKDAASRDLRDYMSDGGTQKAFDYVNNRAKAEGLNPQDMMRAGNEAALGSKNPVSDAVTDALRARTGLMDTAGKLAPVAGAALEAAGQPDEFRNVDYYGTSKDGPVGEGRNALMGPPPNMPDPLPTGEGIVPSGMNYPPPQDPNAEIAPPPNRLPRGRR